MESAKWSVGGLVVLLLAVNVLAEEPSVRPAGKRDLEALQGVWVKVRVSREDAGVTGRLQLHVKEDGAELRLLSTDGRSESVVGLSLQVGEVNGIKLIRLGLLGKKETIAYSVDSNELVLAAERTLFGKEDVGLRGEWVRLEPRDKR
jgi:hypothetical protein